VVAHPSCSPLHDVETIARLPAVPTILRVISETTGLGLTLVARVTEGQWVACAVYDKISFGLEPGDELDLRTTFCKQVRDTRAPVVMDHASRDPVYCDHPTPKRYGFESYISVPVYDGRGEYFGTLCGLDPRPVLVNTPNVMTTFMHFSELISLQLAAEERHQRTTEQLLDARQTAELREQFIAVLSHDLRSPLASLEMAAQGLLQASLDEASRSMVELMRVSAKRMSEMVEDLLDFARAKLGAGIGAELTDASNLEMTLRHVLAELQKANLGRELRVRIEPLGNIRSDAPRLAQLLSNLVSNAFVHGATDRPVDVHVQRSAHLLELSVKNEGSPIPADVQPRLFQPYTRGGPGSTKGLGLGLYIVKQIADAHGGTVELASTEAEGTSFTFRMPLPAPCQPTPSGKN
jgi:signal transduction histidine kinase